MSSKDPPLGSTAYLRNQLYQNDKQQENDKFGDSNLHGEIVSMKSGQQSGDSNATSAYQKVYMPEIHGSVFVDPTNLNKYSKTAGGERAARIAHGSLPVMALEQEPDTTKPAQAGSVCEFQRQHNGYNKNTRSVSEAAKLNKYSGNQTTIKAASADAVDRHGKFQSGDITTQQGAFSSGQQEEISHTPAPAPSEPAPPSFVENVYKAFGKDLGDPPEHSVRLVGVRKGGATNSFTDTMHIFVKTADGWNTHAATITTAPGITMLGKYTGHPLGTAVVASPQFAPASHKIGKHHGSYDALRQTGNLYYWRDNNRNKLADNSEMTNVKLYVANNRGINIHRASAGKTTKSISANYREGSKKKNGDLKGMNVYYVDANGKTHKQFVQLYTFSAGCQVYATSSDFDKMMNWVKTDASKNGTTTWDYALLDEADYNSIKNGTDISAQLKSKMEYYAKTATKDTS